MTTANDFIPYVESVDTSELSDMLASRIIPSFIQAMHCYEINSFSDIALKYWYIDMLAKEMKPATAKRYIGALHTLFKKWKSSRPDGGSIEDVFINAIPDVPAADSSENIRRIAYNYQNITNITKISAGLKGDKLIINSAFQFLLYNPTVTLAELVDLKFGDYLPESQHLQDLAATMRTAPQAKYIFPLQQGKKRQPAIIKDLLSSLHMACRSAGLSFGDSFSRESITSIWIYSAMQLAVPIPDILSVVKVLPPDYSFLSVLEPRPLTPREESEIISRVADNINNKTPRWFVMKLRVGVTPDDIKGRLTEQNNPLGRIINYFYPLRSIKKMEKKKMVTVEIPYLPGILFFKLAADKVSRLMGAIGDLAWCFRTTANPSSPYSAISQQEMKTFQKCIGSFTSDIEIDLISELPELEVGDEVMIEDGSMLTGQQATIRKIKSVDGTVTYTLRLSDTAFIRWKEVSLPASHLTKL